MAIKLNRLNVNSDLYTYLVNVDSNFETIENYINSLSNAISISNNIVDKIKTNFIEVEGVGGDSYVGFRNKFNSVMDGKLTVNNDVNIGGNIYLSRDLVLNKDITQVDGTSRALLQNLEVSNFIKISIPNEKIIPTKNSKIDNLIDSCKIVPSRSFVVVNYSGYNSSYPDYVFLDKVNNNNQLYDDGTLLYLLFLLPVDNPNLNLYLADINLFHPSKDFSVVKKFNLSNGLILSFVFYNPYWYLLSYNTTVEISDLSQPSN